MTKDDVLEIQNEWGSGVVRIGELHAMGADYKAYTEEFVKNFYAFGETKVLFKPTKAKDTQFRDKVETAISYFSAHNGACSEDKGFALMPWTKVSFENNQILIDGDKAFAIGNYYFECEEGPVKVEYTFGYKKCADGQIKIFIHHSSLPFSG